MDKEKTEMKKDSTITLEFNQLTLWKFATVILGILFIVSLVTGGFRGSSGNGNTGDVKAVKNDPSNQNDQQPGKPVQVDVKGKPVLGDANAPVEIVEYTDYQCPFCGRAFEQSFPQIKKDYIDTGKVRFVLKNYPLPFHPDAKPAAIAANCAFAQGNDQFWKYHDELFTKQDAWSQKADPTPDFKAIAKDLGLDESKFASCLNDPKIAAEVDKDVSQGSADGVSGTPSFFINGISLVGAQPYQAFKQLIDQQLSKNN